VYRGDIVKREQLEKLSGRVAISIVTVLELMQGVNSQRKLFQLYRQLKAFQVMHIDVKISELSFKLFKKYSIVQRVRVQDVLVASTSIIKNCRIFTDNKKDYEFITEVGLYKP
jgi:predicted nucleic acid-binding protein